MLRFLLLATLFSFLGGCASAPVPLAKRTDLDWLPAKYSETLEQWMIKHDIRTGGVSELIAFQELGDEEGRALIATTKHADTPRCTMAFTRLRVTPVNPEDEEPAGRLCCPGASECQPTTSGQIILAWRAIKLNDNAGLATLMNPAGVELVHLQTSDDPTARKLTSVDEVRSGGFPGVEAPDHLDAKIHCDDLEDGVQRCKIAAGDIKQTWWGSNTIPRLIFKVEQK